MGRSHELMIITVTVLVISSVNAFSNAYATGEKLELQLALSSSSKPEWIFYKSSEPILYHPDAQVPRDISVLVNSSRQQNLLAIICKWNTKGAKERRDCTWAQTKLVLARKTGKTKLRSGESLRFLLNETAGTEISEKIPTETQTPTTTSQSTFDYWNSKVTVRLVFDDVENSPLVELYYRSDDRNFYPPLTIRPSLAAEDLIGLPNNSLSLRVFFEFQSSSSYSFFRQIEMAFSVYQSLGIPEEQLEDIKRIFLETNPYFLMFVGAISVLHLIFDFLAFKSEISFWRSERSLQGISIRSMIFGTCLQTIVLLYLRDNDASPLVLIPSTISYVINLWKLTRVFARRHTLSSSNSAGNEADSIAMRWCAIALTPVWIGYATYSLLYQRQKGWYSWVLQSAVSMVYIAGFVLMLPQLFINYRLKSVSHLPWRVFVYKALNTFIDDIFAFLVHMPTMHRISTLRDDVIFFIFLYQRWIYPVDPKRGTPAVQKTAEKAEALPAAAKKEQ